MEVDERGGSEGGREGCGGADNGLTAKLMKAREGTAMCTEI